MYGLIYKLTNKLDGKIYVGQTTYTVEKRFKEHKRCKSSHIGRAIRKYGAENFTQEVLEECETAEQLNERERFWVAYFDCIVPKGYNMTYGGDCVHIPETRAHISESLKGENHPHYGIPLTAEHRAHISESLSGEKHPQYGKPLTDEHKAKISASMSGEKAPFFGRHHDDKTKALISEKAQNKRKVFCVETNETFESLSMAARCNNIHVTNIYRACQSPHLTAAGKHWRYVDEN